MAKHILVVAGEASGDMHAATLIQTVKQKDSSIIFLGMGGAKMQALGFKNLFDPTELAVVGITEILPRLWKFYSAFRIISNQLKANPPDLVILVDFSGFNLKIAKVAKALGIKVLYYISPQVWASRAKRIQTIKKYVDLMVVIFPFEVTYYKQAHVPVKLIKHPLLKEAISNLTLEQARSLSGLNAQKKTVGLLPGSRINEIKKLLPLLLETAQLLQQEHTDLQFVLPVASSLQPADITAYLNKVPFDIKVVKHSIYDVLRSCDAVIVASGTATLQVALMEVPMVIVYKLSALTFALAKRLVKLTYIGLCNIVAEQKVANEFIQTDATPKNIAHEINKILYDSSYSYEAKQKLKVVRMKLADAETTEQLADIVMELINK